MLPICLIVGPAFHCITVCVYRGLYILDLEKASVAIFPCIGMSILKEKL
jgi:hypothetical protein